MRRHVYDPAFGAWFSIKSVLPDLPLHPGDDLGVNV